MRQIEICQYFLWVLLSTLCVAISGYRSAAVAEEASPAGWHLLTTARPRGGESVSINHTADTRRSDLDLAGILLQCPDRTNTDADSAGGGPQVIIVIITPFPPHTRPSVSIEANGQQWQFETSVISPGSELLLPPDAAVLAAGAWQGSRELRVDVSSQERSFGGVIPIVGLAGALGALSAHCP